MMDNKQSITREVQSISKRISDPKACIEELKTAHKLTDQQKILLLAFVYGNICTGTIYSSIAPFFPEEVRIRGGTLTENGVIFAIYEIAGTILCPVYGKLLQRYPVKYVSIISLFILSFFTSCFGREYFIGLALILRVLSSIGAAGFSTSVCASISLYFPHHIPQIFGTFEMSFGLGMMFGPIIGSLLYEFAGFWLPFVVLAPFTMITIIPLHLKMDVIKNSMESNISIGIWTVLSHMSISSAVIASFSGCVIIAFNDSTLQAHLKNINISRPTMVGLILFFLGLVYAVGTQIIGILIAKTQHSQLWYLLGLLICALSCVILGPMEGIPIKPNLWLIIIAQIFMGCGASMALVASFSAAMSYVESTESLSHSSTTSVVSSLFVSSYNLGSAAGPGFGGFFVHKWGYQRSCLILFLTQVIMILIVMIPFFGKIKK